MRSQEAKRLIGDLSLAELSREVEALGEPSYRARQIFKWIYQKGLDDWKEATDLPLFLRKQLGAHFDLRPFDLETCYQSRDGTQKFVFRLKDNNFIETVLIPSGERRTLCLSTQVGCKFGCLFCASGLPGFIRHLSPGEITGQILFIRHDLELSLTNFVFMGMGEPLDNFPSLAKAIEIMNSPEGLGIAARRITVSTCGVVPGIKKLKDLGLQVNLSLSLHAPNDELRRRLVPLAKKYSLEEVLSACEEYAEASGRIITLEYVLINGVNNSLKEATQLAKIAHRLRAKINLIPYSPVPGQPFQRPDRQDVEAFKKWLKDMGAKVTVRLSKGLDIQAACGQLAGRFLSTKFN
ncbi:MAG: 23S rRNA (adenine(2503)-C(2))-methyltransferase RlmN [Candidatus Aminicenantes bacterium]|nr:23S rRNA (adenine(2503)-C(2))-methyltransferase RlmN [Candidatus Aminicenantes bacterium]